MIVERLSFRAKYGHGDALANLFREPGMIDLMRQQGTGAMRIYTDVTGPMFTIQVEQEVPDFEAYARQMSGEQEMFSTPFFQDWFGRMTEHCDLGERQLLRVESL
jgi:hypothetical protein